ncbi:hypothetical protein F5X99DRAFT_419633 [Biscogniauxia marginata]|nr:hypothetical protein F5X99DRAFT_419633 [Biscogniauxia marginata]
MPTPRPELRKRRYQPRSRNGCITCKGKRIRCDERRPLCTYCLVKGGKCGYTVTSSDSSEASQTAHDDSALWSQGRASLPDMTPNHIFVGYPIKMGYESTFLFTLLHFALLLSSIRWTWDMGSMLRIRKSYLHHKLEAIKFVNEQLQDPKTALADSTIASIVGLALAESALGNRDIATAHMNGLTRVVQMRDAKAVTGGNTFQGLIGDVEGQQSLSPCNYRSIGDKFNGDDENCAATMIHDILEASAHGKITGRLASEVPLTIGESRERLMSCYLSVFAILGSDSIDPFIINWLVEWMLSDLCHEEEVVRRGTFPRKLWFWGAMKSMCAVTATRANSDLEAYQIDKWRVLCQEKIRLVSRTLNLTTWEQVKELFVAWAWRDKFDEEQQLREMWEEAVFGKRIATIPIVALSYLDRHDFMSVEERERSISLVQIDSMRI